MTHEPECPTGIDWYEMCECESLRSAYQRGREDAAKAIESVIPYLNSLNMPTTPAWTLWESQLISGCIVVARGETTSVEETA